MGKDQTITVDSESDVILARTQVRDLARALGMNLADQARVSLATSSLAKALGLGGMYRGQMTIESCCAGKRTGVRVVCAKNDDARYDLAPGAFGETKWLVDELTLAPLPSNGLQVTLIKWLG